MKHLVEEKMTVGRGWSGREIIPIPAAREHFASRICASSYKYSSKTFQNHELGTGKLFYSPRGLRLVRQRHRQTIAKTSQLDMD